MIKHKRYGPTVERVLYKGEEHLFLQDEFIEDVTTGVFFKSEGAYVDCDPEIDRLYLTFEGDIWSKKQIVGKYEDLEFLGVLVIMPPMSALGRERLAANMKKQATEIFDELLGEMERDEFEAVEGIPDLGVPPISLKVELDPKMRN